MFVLFFKLTKSNYLTAPYINTDVNTYVMHIMYTVFLFQQLDCADIIMCNCCENGCCNSQEPFCDVSRDFYVSCSCQNEILQLFKQYNIMGDLAQVQYMVMYCILIWIHSQKTTFSQQDLSQITVSSSQPYPTAASHQTWNHQVYLIDGPAWNLMLRVS